MSYRLPREWGEAGALRVSDISDSRARKVCGRKVQSWIKDEFGDRDVAKDAAARALRAQNQAKADASRHHRPARVS